MKVRNGFVSNSSSSSFMMVGVEIPEGEDISTLPLDTYHDGYTFYSGVKFSVDEYCTGTVGFEAITIAAEKVMLLHKNKKLKIIYGLEHD